jgi:AcrR family transcriptional regulator
VRDRLVQWVEMTKSRDPSQPDASRRILDAAIAALDANSEASIRVLDIAAAAGVAPGSISYYFGGRDGLVAKAQERRYVRDIGAGFASLLTFLLESGSRASTIEGARARFTSIGTNAFAQNRLSRISALSASHGRPELRAELSEVIAVSIDGTAEAIALGQEMKIFRADVDARVAATVYMSLGLGLVVADFDARAEPEADVSEFIGKLFDVMVAPEP